MNYDYTYTYSELLDKIKNFKQKDFPYPEERSSINEGYHFTLTNSFGEAIQLATYGWKESNTIKDISYNLDGLIPTTQFKDTILYDVAGDEPDVTRFLANEPENMLVFTQEEDLDHKQVHLLVNCGFSFKISSEVVYNRGAVVVTLINKLEDLGYRVKLDICNIVENKKADKYVRVLTQVKDYTEQMDVDRIAFCLCHPSFLRRIIFSVFESLPKTIIKEFGFLEGHGYAYPSDNIQGFSFTLYTTSISSFNQYQYSSLERCVETIQKQITEIIHKKNSY